MPSFSVENVATPVVEASSHSLHGRLSMPDIFRVLEKPYFTVQKSLTAHFEFLSLQTQGCEFIVGQGLRGS